MGTRVLYIAGPISGTTDFHGRFKQGMQEVIQLGYTPVNPVEVNLDIDDDDPASRNAGLRADIRALLECNGIYLLRGWENSRGARLEKLIADGLDMTVLYQTEPEPPGLTRYLMASCREATCRLCATPMFKRTSDMHHTGLTAYEELTGERE